MNTLGFYFSLGFEHVLDPNGLDHFYFLTVLAIPFVFRDWRRVLWLVTLFTLGHTLSLALAYHDILAVNAVWIEFLIPVTIVASCIPILLDLKSVKTSSPLPNIIGFLTFAFGLIHGLGFARYFGQVVLKDDAYTALLSFAVGVEAAQLLIVLGVLLVNFVVMRLLGLQQQRWQLIIAAMVAALAGQMMIANWPG